MFDSSRIKHEAFDYYARLGRVRSYVASHRDEWISLADAARVAGLEETYFSKFFHRKAGVCFKDWIRHERIRRACDMIRKENHTITTVAFAIGYRDLRTFERAFKACTGMTPQAFKQAARPS